MKYTWQPEDIMCGRIVCRPEHEFSDRKSIIERQFKPSSWTANWTYKIGWLAGGNPQREYHPIKGNTGKEREEYVEKHRADYCAIAMTDGMITNSSNFP